jgi:hypothetical protein
MIALSVDGEVSVFLLLLLIHIYYVVVSIPTEINTYKRLIKKSINLSKNEKNKNQFKHIIKKNVCVKC